MRWRRLRREDAIRNGCVQAVEIVFRRRRSRWTLARLTGGKRPDSVAGVVGPDTAEHGGRGERSANRQLSHGGHERSTLTPTKTPPTFFRCPWNLPDGFTRDWICAWRGSGHVAADLREATRTGKRTSCQRGGTAVDARGTSRTQSAESMRWVVATNKKMADEHRRRHAPSERRARAGSTWPRPGPSGTLKKMQGGIRRIRAGSPPARLPPRGSEDNDGLA